MALKVDKRTLALTTMALATAYLIFYIAYVDRDHYSGVVPAAAVSSTQSGSAAVSPAQPGSVAGPHRPLRATTLPPHIAKMFAVKHTAMPSRTTALSSARHPQQDLRALLGHAVLEQQSASLSTVAKLTSRKVMGQVIGKVVQQPQQHLPKVLEVSPRELQSLKTLALHASESAGQPGTQLDLKNVSQRTNSQQDLTLSAEEALLLTIFRQAKNSTSKKITKQDNSKTIQSPDSTHTKVETEVEQASGNISTETLESISKVINTVLKETHSARKVMASSPVNLTISAPTKPSVILYAKYRTGSTFAATFLQKHSRYFVTFEPLHLEDQKAVKKTSNHWISEVLNCRFRQLQDKWLASPPVTSPMKPLWRRRTFCFKYDENTTCGHRSIDSLEADCAAYPMMATKVILVPYLSDLAPFMERGVKVVHLVRDPRGVIGSMLKVSRSSKIYNNKTALVELYLSKKWYRKDIEIRNYCRELTRDLEYAASNIAGESCVDSKCKRDLYHLVRYEDLATEPHDQLQRLYRFLGDTPSPGLVSWIDKWSGRAQGQAKMTHSYENAYGVFRNNSTQTALGWRSYLPIQIIASVQKHCGTALRELGYATYDNVSDLESPDKPILMAKPKLYDMYT